MPIRPSAFFVALVGFLCAAPASKLWSDDIAPPLEREIAPESWLVAGDMPPGGGRDLIGDEVGLRLLLGTFEPPKDGAEFATFQHAGARSTWHAVATPGGKFTQGVSGKFYAYACVELAGPRRALVAAEGVARLYVNGFMVPGDPYAAGFARFPVQLQAGKNHLYLLAVPRGGICVKLLPPTPAPIQCLHADITAPDAVQGRPLDAPIGIPVANTSSEVIRDAVLVVGDGRRFERSETPIGPVAAGQVLKVAARLVGKTPFVAGEGKDLSVPVMVLRAGTLSGGAVTIRLRAPGESYKRTFISRIDGSVQYCGVVDAGAPSANSPPGLVLTLHGAAVEGIGQASAYSAKPGLAIVAPTNRRPFGFDWEDWGMLDALETLDRACDWYSVDRDRVYLTGHSMGGHGVWVVGLLNPDRFAAIAPSAGWASFALYGAGGGSSVSFGSPALQDILARCRRHSDLLGFLKNARQYGVYLLHGVDDDNVPVSQARMMKYFLERFHTDLAYHEEPGAGHWWDKTHDRPGADCVDWPPMFEFFGNHTRAQRPADFSFVTPSPAIASRCRWLEVVAEESPESDARFEVTRDPSGGPWRVRTSNVTCLAIDFANGADAAADVDLEGTVFAKTRLAAGRCLAVRGPFGWKAEERWNGKRPGVHGPLKEVFFRPFRFVYGASGTPEETEAARTVAVTLANLWWVRGNGAVRVTADRDLTPAEADAGNLVLFGNEESNSLIARARFPIRVARGAVTAAGHAVRGGGVAAAFVHPAPGGGERLWAVYGGTDAAGIRLSVLGEVMRSGVGLPDFTVWDGEAVIEGFGAARAAGYFDAHWELASGLAWYRD